MTPLDHVASAAMCGDAGPGQRGIFQPIYLEQVIQCLRIGDYSRGGPYSIEALHYYFVLEHARRRDADERNWSLYGLVLRLALRKGYHRDPSQFPNLTPFEGEIRRRLWIMLYGMDVAISLQMGMPRLIKDEQCDTKPPRNLLDADFDEDIQELPVPRADTEITRVLFWVARYKLMVVIAKIADMSLRTIQDEDPCSSPRIKQVDRLLRTTYGQLPRGLKFTSLPDCLGCSPEDIANKLSISLLLQKGLIMLHRQHAVSEGPSDDGLRYQCSPRCVEESVRTCIDAAQQMLEYQELIYHESQDGGALASLRWRLSSSPISHEFLMATSVLYSYLRRVYRNGPDIAGASDERRHGIERALSRTYGIWQSQSSRSKDAKRAADALGMLIGKLQENSGTGAPHNDSDDILVDHLMPELQFGVDGTTVHDDFGLYGEVWHNFGGILS